MPEKYIRLIHDMYQGYKTVVCRAAAGESNSFGVVVGLHQGSPIPVPTPDGCVDRGCEKGRTCINGGDDAIDMPEYLDTWWAALEDRGMRVIRPKT